jgi:hypothetical protein
MDFRAVVIRGLARCGKPGLEWTPLDQNVDLELGRPFASWTNWIPGLEWTLLD